MSLVFSDADGSIWRFVGFRPDRIERGRFQKDNEYLDDFALNISRLAGICAS